MLTYVEGGYVPDVAACAGEGDGVVVLYTWRLSSGIGAFVFEFNLFFFKPTASPSAFD